MDFIKLAGSVHRKQELVTRIKTAIEEIDRIIPDCDAGDQDFLNEIKRKLLAGADRAVNNTLVVNGISPGLSRWLAESDNLYRIESLRNAIMDVNDYIMDNF